MWMKTKQSKYHNQDPVYYKYREFVVGFFVLLPMILIPLIFASVVVKSDWAKERFSLHFTHKLSAQLNEGNEVYILSKAVGHVKDVNLDRHGYVSVMIRVDEEYRHLIKQDTKVRFKQKNLVMGDWQLELILGDVSSQMVEDGDTLGIIQPVDFQKLGEEAITITHLISEILDTVAHGNGVITRLLINDSLINSRVDNTSKDLRKALKQLNSLLYKGDKFISSSTKVIDSVAVRVPQLFDDVDTVLTHADSVILDVESILDDAKPLPDELFSMIQKLNKDLDEGEILLKALQKHWILRKEVEEVRKEMK